MGLVTLLAAIPMESENLSIFDPASPSALAIRHLFLLVLAVAAGIFLLVEGVLLYSVFRFRRRSDTTTEPPQVYGSAPIEIAWTVAPAIIVFVFVLILARTEYEARRNPEQPPKNSQPIYVKVIGHQWWWEYVYQERDGDDFKTTMTTANELHIPASDAATPRPVFLTLESADVCHSYWVPRLSGKTDLIPGKVNHMWFQSSAPRLYLGQCAEYCGTQHANMLLRVVVEPIADYERWLANERKPAVDDPAVREGRKVFFSNSCVNCHTLAGTSAQGKFGPDLTHLMSRQTIAGGMVSDGDRQFTREQLLQWVTDPQKVKPGCLMPAFGLSRQENERLVDFLRSLR